MTRKLKQTAKEITVDLALTSKSDDVESIAAQITERLEERLKTAHKKNLLFGL